MEIKEILKKRRLEKQLTLDDVGQAVGVSAATISRWESGDIANMRRDKIVKLAKALEISPAVIMGWSDAIDETGENKVYAYVHADSKEDAIFIAIKNMLIANGNEHEASSITKEEAVLLYNSLGFDDAKLANDESKTSVTHFNGDEYSIAGKMNYLDTSTANLTKDNNDKSKSSDLTLDPDIRRIQRAREKMSEQEKNKMMKILELSFDDYFGDDFIDEDDD